MPLDNAAAMHPPESPGPLSNGELTAQLKLGHEKFDAFGSDVFLVNPDADPEQVRDAACALMDLVHEFSAVTQSGHQLDMPRALAVIQFMSAATQAAYRALLGG